MYSAAVISTLWSFLAFRLPDLVVSVLLMNPLGICNKPGPDEAR